MDYDEGLDVDTCVGVNWETVAAAGLLQAIAGLVAFACMIPPIVVNATYNQSFAGILWALFLIATGVVGRRA